MTLPGCVLPKRGCAVVEAKDGQVAVLTAALERERRLGLRLAEVERRLGMDVTDSGTPPALVARFGLSPTHPERRQ